LSVHVTAAKGSTPGVFFVAFLSAAFLFFSPLSFSLFVVLLLTAAAACVSGV